MLYKVTLDQMEFSANHGLYDFEKEKGNTFFLNITLQKELPDHYIFKTIDHTTNYEVLYRMAAKHMATTTDLLEQVIQNLAEDIKKTFTGLSKITISMSKLNPPVGGPCKQSEVTIEYVL